MAVARGYRRRRLLVKAWKTILYSRMHSLHKHHTLKLSQAYYTRRLQHYAFRGWRYYVRSYLPEERNSMFAVQQWARKAMRKVIE